GWISAHRGCLCGGSDYESRPGEKSRSRRRFVTYRNLRGSNVGEWSRIWYSVCDVQLVWRKSKLVDHSRLSADRRARLWNRDPRTQSHVSIRVEWATPRNSG